MRKPRRRYRNRLRQGNTDFYDSYLSADYERGVFNVSACSWVAGAEENIVTIPSKDSCDAGDGCPPGSGGKGDNNGGLNGGAIAGIVIGAVVAAIIICAVILYMIRRQRKKKVYAAQEPEADMAVITGPVHNHHSTRTGKYYSPDTIGTSTDAGGSEDNRDFRAVSTNETSSAAESGRQELDGQGTEVGQTTTTSGEIESQGHQVHGEEEMPSDSQATPVYHELGGKEIAKAESGVGESSIGGNMGGPPLSAERKQGDDHLDSPFVSTLGSTGWDDRREDGSPDLVSPTTPVHHGS